MAKNAHAKNSHTHILPEVQLGGREGGQTGTKLPRTFRTSCSWQVSRFNPFSFSTPLPIVPLARTWPTQIILLPITHNLHRFLIGGKRTKTSTGRGKNRNSTSRQRTRRSCRWQKSVTPISWLRCCEHPPSPALPLPLAFIHFQILFARRLHA